MNKGGTPENVLTRYCYDLWIFYGHNGQFACYEIPWDVHRVTLFVNIFFLHGLPRAGNVLPHFEKPPKGRCFQYVFN